MTAADEAITVLRERMSWLTERIKAKQIVGWETQWDQRERDALQWALTTLADHQPVAEATIPDGTRHDATT